MTKSGQRIITPKATVIVKFYQYFGTGGSLGRFVQELVPAVSEMLPEVRFIYGMPKAPHTMAKKDRHLPIGFRLNGSRVGNVLRSVTSEVSLWLRLQRLARCGGKVLLWELSQWLVSPWLSSRTMTTVCDLIQLSHPRSRQTSVYYRYCGVPLLRRKRLCVAISEHVRRQLIEEGVQRSVHAPCFVSDLFYQAEMDYVRGADAPYLFVGTLAPHKNLNVLLRLYENKAPARRLLCVVPEFERAALLAEVGRRQLVDKVTVVCRLSDMEMRAVYGRAFALICPSLDEGFGMPVAEAMATGLAVVASDIEIMHEVCGEGAAYFDSADPNNLESVLSSLEREEGRRARINAGHAQSLKYRLSATAGAYCRLIEGLL